MFMRMFERMERREEERNERALHDRAMDCRANEEARERSVQALRAIAQQVSQP